MSFILSARYVKAYELRAKVIQARKDGDDSGFVQAEHEFETELIALAEAELLQAPFLRFIFRKE